VLEKFSEIKKGWPKTREKEPQNEPSEVSRTYVLSPNAKDYTK